MEGTEVTAETCCAGVEVVVAGVVEEDDDVATAGAGDAVLAAAFLFLGAIVIKGFLS